MTGTLKGFYKKSYVLTTRKVPASIICLFLLPTNQPVGSCHPHLVGKYEDKWQLYYLISSHTIIVSNNESVDSVGTEITHQ